MVHEKPYRFLTKKEKKALLLKKNKRHQHLFHLMRLRMAEAARVKEMEESRNKPRREDKKSDKEWGDKVARVRNRLTGKQRKSKERWNRFAGTSDGGGRGL